MGTKKLRKAILDDFKTKQELKNQLKSNINNRIKFSNMSDKEFNKRYDLTGITRKEVIVKVQRRIKQLRTEITRRK